MIEFGFLANNCLYFLNVESQSTFLSFDWGRDQRIFFLQNLFFPIVSISASKYVVEYSYICGLVSAYPQWRWQYLHDKTIFYRSVRPHRIKVCIWKKLRDPRRKSEIPFLLRVKKITWSGSSLTEKISRYCVKTRQHVVVIEWGPKTGSRESVTRRWLWGDLWHPTLDLITQILVCWRGLLWFLVWPVATDKDVTPVVLHKFFMILLLRRRHSTLYSNLKNMLYNRFCSV